MEALIASQAKGLLLQIKRVSHLELDDATEMTTIIDSGPWTTEQSTELAIAIGNKVGSEEDQPANQIRRGLQMCMCFENFLTEEDWNIIFDTCTPLSRKINHLAMRAVSLGIVCPSENTVKRMTAVIIFAAMEGDTTLSAQSKNQIVVQIKQAIKLFSKDNKLTQHITKYPATAAELDPACASNAYGDAPVPLPVSGEDSATISTVEATLQGCLRKTGKELRANKDMGGLNLSTAANSPNSIGALQQALAPLAMLFSGANSCNSIPLQPGLKSFRLTGAHTADRQQPDDDSQHSSDSPIDRLRSARPIRASRSALLALNDAPHASAGDRRADAPHASAGGDLGADAPHAPAGDRPGDIGSIVAMRSEHHAADRAARHPEPSIPITGGPAALVDHERIMLEAHRKREEAKAIAKAKAKAAKAAADAAKSSAAADSAAPAPAAPAPAPETVVSKRLMCKRPASTAATSCSTVPPKKSKTEWPPAPFGSIKAKPPTVFYNGATIYTCHKVNAYRAKLTTGDKVDKKFPFKDDYKKAWAACMTAIDNRREEEATEAKKGKKGKKA